MALGAVKVIVLWVAVVVLIDGATVELKASKEPCINEFFECPVHSRPRYVVGAPFSRELVHQLIGVEMLVMAEDSFDQEASLFGISLSTALQVFLETLDWRHRDRHAS